MPVPARIIAVDDELPHLLGLVRGLTRSGWACLQVHYPHDLGGMQPCAHARIVFTDLHLDAGGALGGSGRNYSIVQSLLEESVSPVGPYLVVVWTNYPEEASALAVHLNTRMVGAVAPPVAVVPLAKERHLDHDGKLADPERFVATLRELVAGQPQFAALLNWEQKVLGAAAGAVAELFALTHSGQPKTQPPPTLERVIAQLAKASVGRQNVDIDRFQAVNEALLPILADRVGVLRGDEDDKATWERAFQTGDLDANLDPAVEARLNKFLHVEHPPPVGAGCYRGAVVELPPRLLEQGFEARFTIKSDGEVAKKQFGIKTASSSDSWNWRLVQVQAACDMAQKNPGPLPFVLAAEVRRGAHERPPGAAWLSPWFATQEGEVRLVLNPRFMVDLSASEAITLTAVYRLREQIMAEVSHHVHSQGSRPGIISFGKR